jgi:hypothetical protein
VSERGQYIFSAEAVSLPVYANPPLNPESTMPFALFPGEDSGVMKLVSPELSPCGEKRIFLIDVQNSVSMPLRTLFHPEGDG